MKALANNPLCDRRGIYSFVVAVSLAASLTLLASPSLLRAQEFRATLTGQVTDATGAIVPKADIKAINVETGSVYTAQTSDAGVYYIPYVVPGTYKVTATAPGFRTSVQDNVVLLAGKYFGQNFKLEVGGIHEEIEVKAEPPMIETANGSGGTILDEKTLQNVPVIGRQVYNLISTTPGSQFTGSSQRRSWDNDNAYIMGGGVDPTGQDNTGNSGGFNQFTLNGTNITQQISYGNQGAGTWNVSPMLDSIQEVNVMTDTYDARYGRTTGGTVNVVTKNGTNVFHGEAIESYKDGSLFDANTLTNVFISGLPTQQQVENQFGGNFGGPIIRNKVWFFFSFEGYRQSVTGTLTGNVPPAYLRPGYNGNTGVDFGLIQTLDPGTGVDSNGVPIDHYLHYGLALYQPGDSTNPNNPNNAVCGQFAPYGQGQPASACGTGTNVINNVNAFNGGTNGGALIPAAQINQTAMKMLSAGYIPLPNVGGAQNYVGGYNEPANYFAATPDFTTYNQPMIRVDYNSSDKTKWYSFFGVQKGHENRNGNGLSGLLANGTFFDRDSYTATQDMTHVFSSTFLGDFKISFTRLQNRNADGILSAAKPGSTIGLNITPPPVTTLRTVPEIRINGFPDPDTNGDGPIFGNSDDLEASTNVAFDTDFTVSKGAHNLHFGGGIFYYTYGNPINGTVANNANGNFAFSGQWTRFDPLNANCYQPANKGFSVTAATACSGDYAPNGSGWADFLLGLPSGGNVNWNDSLFDYQPVWNLYFQDDWRITHRLTVNLGLRYDVQVGLRERYNELPRGFCETCVNPITTDGIYQANVNNAANVAAWKAAGVNTSAMAQVLGTIAPAGVNGAPRKAYNTDWSNVAPRVGFAFAVNPNTVVRGGWGFMYGGGLEGGSPIGYQQQTNYLASTDTADPNQGGAAPGSATAGPYGLGTPFPATAAYPLGLQPPVGEQGLALAGVGSGGLQVDSPLRKIPRTQVTSFGVQRALPGNMALDLHFSGNYTSRLRATLWDNGTLNYAQLQYALAPGSSVYSQLLPNPYYGVFAESFPSGCGQSPTIPALALLLKWSQYCGFNSAPPVGIYNAPIGKNWYNALEAKLTKRTSHGLTLNLAYTYSKNMDGSGYQNGYPYQDANEVHWISQFDRTHVLAVTGVYDVPVGRGRSLLSTAPRPVDYALGGWSLGWSFGAQSGTPLNINGGFNYSCPFASPNGTSVGQWLNPKIGATNSTCYTSVSHIGGSGYTYNTTPSYITEVRNYTVPDLDLSLQKSFNITERVSFSLRGEAFNALNSVLLGGPDTSPTDGPASLFYNTTTKRSYWSGFGTVGPTQDNFPRNLRITGKIIF